MGSKVPCKDCPDRHPSCHSDCSNYKEWLRKLREAKAKDSLARSSVTIPSARLKTHNSIENLIRKRR